MALFSQLEMDWELIVNNLPNNLNDMLYQNSSKDTYNFQDIFFSGDGGSTWNYGSIPHQYNNSGVKIIKAIVFSYVLDETDDYINPLMWKACSIKLYLGVDNAYVEDFGDLGGVGYSFIPWPNTSGIISGISRESAYVNSIESMIQQNLFNDDEIWEKNLLDLAFENTPDRKKGELGNYIGKVDIGQLRYFQRPYDMTDLLMLDGSYDGFVRYDTWGEWYDPYNEVGGSADNPIWLEESCVALLFIKDDTNIDRLESCIIELNMNNINGITIRDTSGNDNRGLVLGDYALSKPDHGVEISREEPSEYPEINIEKKAF